MDSDKPVREQKRSIKKTQENPIMKERIRRLLTDEETQAEVASDFLYTFEQLGLTPGSAKELCHKVFTLLKSDRPLLNVEAKTLRIFEDTRLKVGGKERNIIEILHEKLKDRAKIITSQVTPALSGVKGKVIDYGAGDGQVTQMLHDRLGLDIEGADIRQYKTSSVTVPIKFFSGDQVDAADGTYEAGLLTNVLHHEKANERILNELDRIVRRKLVVLETVPVGATEEAMAHDKDRTFMNDYLYNRLFHNADVPVPGTFETPKKWIARFVQHGWKLVQEKDLGFDQPTIRDRHYLLVFER